MSFHVTQCPGCDSTFNTNARILQAAAGKVRCGACLTVFEAADNFIAVNDPDEGEDTSVFVGYNPADYFDPSQFISRSALTAPGTEPFEASVPQTSELPPGQKDYNQAEVEFLTAVATELEPVIPTATTDTPEATAASVVPEVFPEPAEPEVFPEPALAADDIELIDLDLFDYAEMNPADAFETDSIPEIFALAANDINPASDASGNDALTAGDDVVNSVTHDVIDETSDKIIDEVADEASGKTLDEVAAAASDETIKAEEAADEDTVALTDQTTDEDTVVVTDQTTDEDTVASTDEVTDEVIDDSTEAIRARVFRSMLHDDDALEALPQESRTAIGQVLPPVEFLSGRERQWGRRLLLTIACLFLALTLAAQFLWQRLPIYSRTAEWRPLYEFGCRFIACELPVYTEISAIRSDNLVVRSHPTVSNALTVSLSFRNTARFPQPFPVLILSFNSATNAIIALREFAPAEYLDAGLRELQLMPVMSPVQVDIEVMDPGADAVNYTVAFRRP